MKRCARCGEEKPLSEFWRNASRPDGLQTECKPCLAAYQAERRRERPEEPWAVDAKHRYGLTQLDYQLLLRVQGGVCGACGGPPRGNGLTGFAIDHDHRTRRVRGLLCQACNVALNDAAPESLDRFAAYLAKPPAVRAGVYVFARE